MTASRGQKICEAARALKSSKSSFQGTLEDIAFYALPNFEREEKTGDEGTPVRPVSSKPVQASHGLGGNLFSNTISTGQEWFTMRGNQGIENTDRFARQWLYDSTQTSLKYIQNSNFSEAFGSMITLYGTFGTGVLETDFDRERGSLVFRNININEDVFVQENERGLVDSVYRVLRLTARQARQLFGSKALPKAVSDVIGDESQITRKFKFIHAVYPNPEIEPERLDYRSMPFLSCYVFEEEEKIVYESGYRTFPFAVPRFIKIRNFPYGYGAGHNALFTMRELNRNEAALIVAIEMAAHPPLFTPDEDSVDTMDLRPNSVVYVDMTQGRPQEYAVGAGNVGIMHQRVQELKYEIDQLFYADIFQMIRETARDRATATEIRALDEEKLSAIGPMVVRLQSECFSVMIERVVDLLMFYGIIPEPPESLQREGFRVVYTSRIDSKLALVQNQMTISAAQNAAQLLALGSQIPEIATVMKLEEAAKQILERAHIDPALIMTEQERMMLEKAQAEQAQQQQQLEQYKAAVKPADPSAPVAQNSPLAAMAGLTQGGL
jgi:hypothetical protein